MCQYDAIHSCRENRIGGGVSIYLSNIYNFIPRKDLSTELDSTLMESVFIEIPSCPLLNRKSILIGCIYRPPDTDIVTFIDALDSTLESINKEGKLCILLGDYNINLLKGEVPSTIDFLNVLYPVNFYPLITKPSRITSTSATLIDNILFNSLDYEVTSGLLTCDTSDHLPVFQIIHPTGPSKAQPSTATVQPKQRSFTRNRFASFKSAISVVSWDDVLKMSDVNKSLHAFYMIYNSAIESSFPLTSTKSKKYSTKNKPWITDDLRKNSRKKISSIGNQLLTQPQQI